MDGLRIRVLAVEHAVEERPPRRTEPTRFERYAGPMASVVVTFGLAAAILEYSRFKRHRWCRWCRWRQRRRNLVRARFRRRRVRRMRQSQLLSRSARLRRRHDLHLLRGLPRQWRHDDDLLFDVRLAERCDDKPGHLCAKQLCRGMPHRLMGSKP